MSQQTKRQVPVGILYRWTYPTVNPYSCGVEVCSLVCPCEGRYPFMTYDTTDLTQDGKSTQFSLAGCPALTGLLRRMICDHLYRSRPEKILNVF